MARGSWVAGLGAGTGAGDERARPWRALAERDAVDLLDHLTDGILVLDGQWRIRYANETAGAMLQRPHEELLGRHLWTEFPEAIGHPLALHVERDDALRADRPRRLVEYYAPLQRWLEVRVFPLRDERVIVFRDVSDQQLTQIELHEHVDRISEAERIARFGIWRWEVASGRVAWSDELHRIYGLRPGDFEGTVDAFVERVHPDDRASVWASVARSLETLQPFVFQERIRRPDGSERTLLSQGRVIPGPDGSAQTLVGVCHDVTDRARAESALGASERRMRAIIDNTPSLITVKDLDGRYLMGNAEAERLTGVPAGELVGMHCVDVFPRHIAESQLDRDRDAAAEGDPVYGESVLVRDGEPRTYTTVTFALPDEHGVPAETCTIATDVTERRERESARRERLAWTERITAALGDGRMLAYSQPVIDLATGEQTAHELLARMAIGDGRVQVLAPGAFLPAAERYGLIQAIDLWMVGQALRIAARMVPEVNVSAVTICDPAARGEIVELLSSAPAAARRVVFEVTETASVVHLDAAREFAAAVTAVGCRLALDDFGVGFGSLTYLRLLPLSYLKIDLSFVRGLVQSAGDRRVVKAIIGVAREFGLQTIAEGVEDQSTQELLCELGVDFAQGYHLGRPAPLGRL